MYTRYALTGMVFLAATLTLVGIFTHKPTQDSNAAQTANETLTARQAWDLSQRRELIIVDVRRPEEWKQTGSPLGASRISFERHPHGWEGFLRDLAVILDGNLTRPFAIICRTGNRTGSLVPRLQAHGFTSALDIPEGMTGSQYGRGWINQGFPLEQ